MEEALLETRGLGRRFGGLNVDSDLSYAVNHFFLNGGGTCWIVRIAWPASPPAGGRPGRESRRTSGALTSRTRASGAG